MNNLLFLLIAIIIAIMIMKIVIKIIQNAKKEKADYQKETNQYLPMTAYQSLQKGRSKQRQPNS